MHVGVEYSVPLLCDVDTATGEITAVRLLDEEIRLTGQCFGVDGEALDGPEAEAAVGIAESEFWPSWP